MEENKLLRYEAGKKNLFLAFALTFLFGPLGLFYVSAWVPLVMLAILFLIVLIGGWAGVLALGLGGAFIYWGACIAIGLFIAHAHNQDLLREIMREDPPIEEKKIEPVEVVSEEDSIEEGNEYQVQGRDSSMDKYVIGGSILVIAVIAMLFLNHYGVIDWFQEKSRSDYLNNELVIGASSEKSRGEDKIAILSDTIRLMPDSVCLNMNPFTFNTGLQVVKVGSEMRLSNESNLGAYIYLLFNFKNIGEKNFSGKVKVAWKVKEDGAIRFTGTDYFYFDEVIKPGEVWIKESNTLSCSPLYSGKITFSIELNDVPMEDVTVRPKF